MCAREHLALVRARDGALALTTMVFPDEIRPTEDAGPTVGAAHRPTRTVLDAAVAVIEELSSTFEPERYKDDYRARLEKIVARRGASGGHPR